MTERASQESTDFPDWHRSTVTIVVPVFNQLHYTKQFLESVRRSDARHIPIVIIDNGSTDGTAHFLSGWPDLSIITNAENLGCATAWNQGVKLAKSEWALICNNDVLVPEHWLDGLLRFAVERSVAVASPAIREGEMNYDLGSYSSEFVASMSGFSRMGLVDGICFMVCTDVFNRIGLFDEKFRVGQFEDADFFRRVRRAGLSVGTTGRSFIHHFGQITQKSVRAQTPADTYLVSNRSHYRRKWKLHWYKRVLTRWYWSLRLTRWRNRELKERGHSLREKWLEGRLRYF